MKSLIAWSKSILLTFCLMLTAGALASAQQETATRKPDKLAAAEQELKAGQTSTASEEDKKKFYELTDSTTAALVAGEKDKAKDYAEALLKQAETMHGDWNYGNAVHIANLVLGELALASGDVKEAKRRLLAAGDTPGSPQLDSFGPNMRLAKALLDKKEPEAVIEYFNLCAKFWKPDFSKLDQWKAVIEKNEMPEFGANLRYFF
jgi:murein L,D-transpeptidase YcbB/YkuD